jgi:hypothetical protein
MPISAMKKSGVSYINFVGRCHRVSLGADADFDLEVINRPFRH